MSDDVDKDDAEDLAASLTTLLVKTLRALGQAGRPDDGLQLAARAWSRLRHDHPAEAERINGTMHYLARMPTSAPVGTHRGDDRSEDPGAEASPERD